MPMATQPGFHVRETFRFRPPLPVFVGRLARQLDGPRAVGSRLPQCLRQREADVGELGERRLGPDSHLEGALRPGQGLARAGPGPGRPEPGRTADSCTFAGRVRDEPSRCPGLDRTGGEPRRDGRADTRASPRCCMSSPGWGDRDRMPRFRCRGLDRDADARARSVPPPCRPIPNRSATPRRSDDRVPPQTARQGSALARCDRARGRRLRARSPSRPPPPRGRPRSDR